jgi:four helix bundle protein
MFQVHELSLEAIRELRPLVERIRSFERDLADQLVRAASSVVLNIAEGNYSRAGTRRVRSRRRRDRRVRRDRRSEWRWRGGM